MCWWANPWDMDVFTWIYILSSFSKELSIRVSRIGPLSGRVLKTSSMLGLGWGLMTSILASSTLHINILLKVFSTCMESISIFPVFQSIFGLYCFSQGSPKIILSFSNSMTRNLVLIFFLPICILSHMQLLIVPELFLVLSALKIWIFFPIGIKAIPFCSVNFLSIKVPPAPESIRAFISNCLSAFLSSLVTTSGIVKEFWLALASSTGLRGIHVGADIDVEAGRFFKNPDLPWHQSISSFLHLTILHRLSWYGHMLLWLLRK